MSLTGWGRGKWSSGPWSGGDPVEVTGVSATGKIAPDVTGWGRATWSSGAWSDSSPEAIAVSGSAVVSRQPDAQRYGRTRPVLQPVLFRSNCQRHGIRLMDPTKGLTRGDAGARAKNIFFWWGPRDVVRRGPPSRSGGRRSVAFGAYYRGKLDRAEVFMQVFPL